MSDPLAIIIRAVADYHGFATTELTGPRRTVGLVHARHTAMYLCRRLTTASLPQIGDAFGNRDHTTVLYAARKMTDLFEAHPERYNGVLARVRERLVAEKEHA